MAKRKLGPAGVLAKALKIALNGDRDSEGERAYKAAGLDDVVDMESALASQPRLFDAMAEVTEAGTEALESGDVEALGPLFDLAHGYLNACGVSGVANERMVAGARRAGAGGAKLTGAGAGGAVAAVAEVAEPVVTALRAEGFEAFATQLEPTA